MDIKAYIDELLRGNSSAGGNAFWPTFYGRNKDGGGVTISLALHPDENQKALYWDARSNMSDLASRDGHLDWEIVQSVVDREFYEISDSNSAIYVSPNASIKAMMDALMKYGVVEVRFPEIGWSPRVGIAGNGMAWVYPGRISPSASPPEKLGWFSSEARLDTTLRDVRAALVWLKATYKEALSTATCARPRAHTTVLDWLAERANTGVFAVDISDQIVPFLARPEKALPGAGLRMSDEDGHFCRRYDLVASLCNERYLNPSERARIARYDLSYIKLESVKEGQLFIDVTTEFNWSAGQFGDYNSCWWDGNQYNMARSVLHLIGGYAIRLWRKDFWGEWRGVGRSWIAPVRETLPVGSERAARDARDGGCIVFNTYSDEECWDTHRVAALLEHVTGGAPTPVTSVNYPSEMYVNSGLLYLFDSEPESIATIPEPSDLYEVWEPERWD